MLHQTNVAVTDLNEHKDYPYSTRMSGYQELKV